MAASASSSGLTSHWVLLRGLAREARHWGEYPEKLKAQLEREGETARIDMIDLPGAGKFSEMKSPLTVSEITEFVREKYTEIRRKMRERGETPPERTRLVGISLGGMIAADWLTRWPDDFKELILINTSFSGFSPLFDRLTPFAIKHMAGHLRPSTNLEREIHALKLASNSTDQSFAKRNAEVWAKLADERPFTIENFSRQILAAARYRAPKEAPDVPVLVLYSEKDRMVSPSCSKAIIRRWNTASFANPWAGHDLTLDDADWVIEKTLAWEQKLKEIPERPGSCAAGAVKGSGLA